MTLGIYCLHMFFAWPIRATTERYAPMLLPSAPFIVLSLSIAATLIIARIPRLRWTVI